MDRDATPLPPADAPAEVVPPVEWAVVRKVGLVGTGLVAAAAVLGLVATGMGDSVPSAVHTARLVLVLVGAVTAGAAVSMRPDLWRAWAVGGAAALLAVAGVPAHWDSFRLMFGVLAAVALAWAVLRAAPPAYRLPALSAVVLFHFTGIFLATTTPPTRESPPPWVTEQAFIRVFNPYLQFVYLRNAYHFYSPQPGPASILVFMLKTEDGTDPATGEKKYKVQWVAMPKRPGDVKDPLGLSYYRRLAITEQVVRGTPGALRSAPFERNELLARRRFSPIPLHPSEDQESQYQLPQADIARFVVPSYAAHVILENTPDAKTAAKTTVKVYRMQHNMMSIDEFVNWRKLPGAITNPYHPTWYRPFFLGEFGFEPDPDRPGATRIALLNPQEPMLYWLMPITPRPGGVPPGDKTKRNFLDYMSFHALGPDVLGPDTTVDDLGDPRFKDRAFDWDQLR
jgi:hypothetical protein